MKLALVTPLPPAPTPAAAVAEAVLPYLARAADVRVFVESPSRVPRRLLARWRVEACADLPGLVATGAIQRVVHVLADARCQAHQLRLVRQVPGLLWLLDGSLHELRRAWAMATFDGSGAYVDLLSAQYGPGSKGWPERLAAMTPDRRSRVLGRLPLIADLTDASDGVLVSDPQVARRPGSRASPAVLPLPVVAPIAADRSHLRLALGLTPQDFAVALIGEPAAPGTTRAALEGFDAIAREHGSDQGKLVLVAGGEQLRASDTAVPDEHVLRTDLPAQHVAAALDAAILVEATPRARATMDCLTLLASGIPCLVPDRAGGGSTAYATATFGSGARGAEAVAETLRRWQQAPEAAASLAAAAAERVQAEHAPAATAEAILALLRTNPAARVPNRVAPSPRAGDRVEAVVIGYNGKHFIDRCLRSLVEQDHANLRVTVVDNASADGTAEHVRKQWPQVNVIASSRNLGFAAGNNLAFARSDADFFALLNQDAVARRDWVTRLVEAATSDARVAVVGSRMLMARSPTILNSTAIAINEGGWAWDWQIGEKDEDHDPTPRDVFGACGGAVLLRAAALRAAGAFDEAYFMYFEDVDLCWRLRLRGWRVVYAPLAVVEHDYHGDRGTPERALRRRYMCERNHLQTVLKNCEPRTLRRLLPQLRRYDRARIEWLENAARRGEDPDVHRAIAAVIRRAWRWNLLHLPGILWRRRRAQRERVVTDAELQSMQRPGIGEPSHVGDLDLVHDAFSAEARHEVDMGDRELRCFGQGWHDAEHTSDGQAYRWTKGRAVLYLQVRPHDDAITMRLACPPSTAVCRITIDGMPLGTVCVSGAPRTHRFPLPPRHDERPAQPVLAEVELRTSTFRPADLGLGPDHRDLGVAVFGVQACNAAAAAPPLPVSS